MKYYIYDDFRYYKNLEENWKGYIRVINRLHYVNNGVLKASTNRDYITALKKGGYATEDSYIDHILSNIDKFKKDLFNFRFQKINSQITNPAKIGETKKNIARLKTILKEKINA